MAVCYAFIKYTFRPSNEFLYDFLQAPFKNFQETMEIGLTKLFDITDIPVILRNPYNPHIEDNLWAELLRSLVGKSKYTFAALFFCFLMRTNGFIPKSRTGHYMEKCDELKKQIIVSFKQKTRQRRTYNNKLLLFYSHYLVKVA